SGRGVVLARGGLGPPVGNVVPSAWTALLGGRSGAARSTRFDATEGCVVRFACEVKDFEPEQYLDRKEVRRTDRFAQFAVAVAQQAVEDAGLTDQFDRLDRDRIGVIIGSGIGGIRTFEEQARVMLERGPQRISPFFVPMFIADIASGL